MENLQIAIESLTEAINRSNSFDLTAWLLVGVTAVYVLATIAICVANFQSAKATRAQLAEQKRQFDEQKLQFEEQRRLTIAIAKQQDDMQRRLLYR